MRATARRSAGFSSWASCPGTRTASTTWSTTGIYKVGGDLGQGCQTLCLGADGNICGAGANVSVQKSAPTILSEGATSLPYTITVTSDGALTSTAVVMTDTVPAGVTFGSVSTTLGTCSFANGTVTCALGDMAPGTSRPSRS